MKILVKNIQIEITGNLKEVDVLTETKQFFEQKFTNYLLTKLEFVGMRSCTDINIFNVHLEPRQHSKQYKPALNKRVSL